MSQTSDITLCITMGKRPELLKQTLESLFQFYAFEHVIAVNDFGDEATSEVFKRICPHGQLLHLEQQQGHHPAVDLMYERVTTPYVFHCEDDWLFTEAPNLDHARALLEQPHISTVCFRQLKLSDYEPREQQKIQLSEYQGIRFYHLDQLDSQWHGYGFNPHLAKLSLWQNCGGFSQFKKERHISRYLRAQDKHVVMEYPGSCQHIGDGISVSHANENTVPSKWKTWRRSLKRRFLDCLRS